MRRLFLISLLSIALNCWAQQDTLRDFRTSISGNYQSLSGHAFFGGSVDFNHTFTTPNQWLDWGVGIRTGLFLTRVNREENVNLGFNILLDGGFGSTQIRSSGNLFLMPFEVYGLMGHGEDFLEIGTGLQWAQFSGDRQHNTENMKFLYEVQGYQLFPSLHIGYAHIPVDNGITFRALWKPFWDAGFLHDYKSSYVIGLGYSF